jgi:pSer/pThr/pTyr-binding forkhead associated (FHA) protein
MLTFIEVISGPHKGESIQLEDGLSIGRKRGDVVLKDPKLSSQHAHIERRLSGQLVLIDDESVNGIIHENQKVRQLVMDAGVEFKLGSNVFRVIQKAEDATQFAKPKEPTPETNSQRIEQDPTRLPDHFAKLMSPAVPSESVFSEPPTASALVAKAPEPFNLLLPVPDSGPEAVQIIHTRAKKRDSKKENLWKETLESELPTLLATNPAPVSGLGPFRKIVRLEFVQGVQSEKILHLGFGPRKFGSQVLDIELQDPQAPPLAFEIFPEGNQARFVNKEPSIVKLGDRSVASEYLKNGDRISFGDTIIEVTLV